MAQCSLSLDKDYDLTSFCVSHWHNLHKLQWSSLQGFSKCGLHFSANNLWQLGN